MSANAGATQLRVLQRQRKTTATISTGPCTVQIFADSGRQHTPSLLGVLHKTHRYNDRPDPHARFTRTHSRHAIHTTKYSRCAFAFSRARMRGHTTGATLGTAATALNQGSCEHFRDCPVSTRRRKPRPVPREFVALQVPRPPDHATAGTVKRYRNARTTTSRAMRSPAEACYRAW